MNKRIIQNQELISIIVPVYNVADYLKKCVKSIINQTYTNLEIILIDDGSTDDSGILCDMLRDEDERIIVIHKENEGSTASRNLGLDISKGKYVGFVDSDDWIEPNMYEELFAAIKRDKADVAICRTYIQNDNQEYIDAREICEGVFYKKDNIISHNIFYSDDYSNRGISPNLWDKLFIKDKFLNYQKKVDINTRYAEDDLCVFSYLLDAECVSFVNIPLYHYYQRVGSVTKKVDREYFSRISLFYNQMRSVFEKHECYPILLPKLDKYMLELVLRGINSSFGFNYGVVVPFYIPDVEFLYKNNVHKIVLYGAGNVGRDYYSYFIQTKIVLVKAWLDKNYIMHRKEGLDVLCPDMLWEISEFDLILVAVDSKNLAEKISDELCQKYDISREKIAYFKPRRIIENIGV